MDEIFHRFVYRVNTKWSPLDLREKKASFLLRWVASLGHGSHQRYRMHCGSVNPSSGTCCIADSNTLKVRTYIYIILQVESLISKVGAGFKERSFLLPVSLRCVLYNVFSRILNCTTACCVYGLYVFILLFFLLGEDVGCPSSRSCIIPIR